ncbi:hypothetical protein CC80DRAFT_558094, partial [Byssothecium circinans]
MRLTAEIDPSREASRRCFGPRFTNFLHGVQRFAALGDIIIGGSQNLIACGVWSVVRISLLSIVNFSSYMESLSQILMEVGRSSPLHEKMALLYPQSERLQSYLSDYFIVVVSLCHHILTFAQKSAMAKLSVAFSDSYLKKFQSELNTWSIAIKNETHALMAERMEVEAQKSSLLRLNRASLSKQKVHQKALDLRYRILDLCSTHDQEATWKRIRKIGNTTCYRTNQYTTWKEDHDANCQVLVYHGKLGCGKSVMLANIIQDLASQADDSTSIAYFFCRNDLAESLEARTIIGSLTRQLLQPFFERPRGMKDSNFLEEFEHKSNMVYEDMYRILRHHVPMNQRLYVIIDGLDHCDYLEWIHTLICLQDLQDRLANEIENFIEAELARRLEDGTLMIYDPTLILNIQDTLSKSAEGMFLWVVLQIQSLCDMQTDQEIREALTELPRDLSETYRRILQKRQKPQSRYQSCIFELIIAAMRPLTLNEMSEALSVTPGDTDWTAARMLHDVKTALSGCGCLVTINEEELTVGLVHSSVQTFILDGYQNSRGHTINMSTAQETMADILVTYLSYNIFRTEVSKARVPELPVQSMPSGIINSSTKSTKAAGKLALRLLKARKQPSFDMGKTLAGALGTNQVVQEHHLLIYAKSYCLQHVQKYALSPHVTQLLPGLIRR